MMWLIDHLVFRGPDPRPYGPGPARKATKGKYVRRTRLYQEPRIMFMTRKNWLTPEGRHDALYMKKRFKPPTGPRLKTYTPILYYTPRPYSHR